MIGRQRLGFQAAGAGAWVDSPGVAGCDGAAYFGGELVRPGPVFAEDALAPVGTGQKPGERDRLRVSGGVGGLIPVVVAVAPAWAVEDLHPVAVAVVRDAVEAPAEADAVRVAEGPHHGVPAVPADQAPVAAVRGEDLRLGGQVWLCL